MTHKNLHAWLILLVTSSLLLGACSAQNPPAIPTTDPQAIYTQAAMTVEAGVQATRAAQPPTATTAPTEKPAPTMDPSISDGLTATAKAVTQPNSGGPTATLAPGAPTPTLAVVPSATKPVIVNPNPQTSSADKCQWISNAPADNSEVHRKNTFNTYIKVKNTGTSTWNNTYRLRYFAGERFGAPSDFLVQHSVKPNEMYEFVFELVAPDSTGKKELLMVVQNQQGNNMCFINLPLTVIE